MQGHEPWMELALELARRAAREGEVPVGAVLVRDGKVLGSGRNRREQNGDPLAHAEIEAIRHAVQRDRVERGWRLNGTTMYVTLEPCAMCAGALVAARVDELVFATEDPKGGYCGTLGNLVQDPRLNHRMDVVAGVCKEQSQELLRSFFASLRGARKKTPS